MPTIAELTATHRHETDLSKIGGTVESVVRSRYDVIAPQSSLVIDTSDLHTGALIDPNGEPIITETGVMEPRTDLTLSRRALRQTAERIKLPMPFVDRLDGESDDHRALAAYNFNTLNALSTKSAMFRMLQADDGVLLRSVHSNQYGIFDNDLALKAMLEGLTEAGFGLGDCVVEGDYTDSRFRLRVTVPQIAVLVPELLGDYRMPFSMREDRRPHDPPTPGERPPVIHAGFEIGNSETGAGTFYVNERAEIGVCRNGLKKEMVFKKAHVGARLDDGEIQWSADTIEKTYGLIKAQVRDVVANCLSTEYLDGLVKEMTAAKGVEVDAPQATIEAVTDQFQLTEAESTSVFDCFARGGDQTVLGVANAVTAAAQLVEDGDRQSEMEGMFWSIVERPQRVLVNA